MIFFNHSFSGNIVLHCEAAIMASMQSALAQWLYSIKHYCLMCLLLSGPERLPYSVYPLVLSGFAYFVSGLMLVDEQRTYLLICIQIVLELVLLGAICYLILNWKKTLSRLLQTFSALVGINMVLTLVTIPVYHYLGAGKESIDQPLLYATILLLVWNLAVLSMIFRRAFEISTQLSAMLSFGYFLIYQFIVSWLYH